MQRRCLLHRVAVRGSAHPLGLSWVDLLQVWGMLFSSPASPGALFNPEASILIQKHHPYNGNLNSETPVDSKNAF